MNKTSTTIVRFKGFNLESDIFVMLIDKLDKKLSLAKKVYSSAWDMLLNGSGGKKSAIRVIEPLLKRFVDNNFDDVADYALEQDPFMQVNDPRFQGMIVKILALGVVSELVDSPFSYKRFLTKDQLAEAEEMVVERGKRKFEQMFKKSARAKNDKEIAKELLKIAKKFVDEGTLQ